MTPATVSVVVPHYGDPSLALALVDDLRQQTYGSLTLVVADDASPEPFPQTEGVTVVRRAANGGFGAAVNSGAAAATGDLLLILNSDLRIGPTFVADLVAAATPWLPGVVGPRILDSEGRLTSSARRFPTLRHQVVEWLTPLARYRDTAAWRYHVGHDLRQQEATSEFVTDWLVGAALLLPLEEFRAVGGFDESYVMNAEEVDLQRTLRDRGVPSVYVPGVVATHTGGGSSDPAKRRRWLVGARDRYAEKWGGVGALRTALTAATAANLAVNGARRVLGRDVHPLDTALQELDLIWQRRQRAVHSRRTPSGGESA